MYLHIYFNTEKAADDELKFNNMIDRLENELTSGKCNPENEKKYAKYFDANTTPVRGTKVTPKESAIKEAERYYGFFVLLSNEVKDPITALNIYRSKDIVEKAFGNFKERLNLRRTLVSSESLLDGKLFVQFVALIYLSYIKKQMQDRHLFKTYTMQEILDELDVIECFEQPKCQLRIGEVTKKQEQIYADLGIKPLTSL